MKNGTQMRARRERIPLTQDELAALIGVDQSTLARWETGKQRPLRALRLAWENELARAERARRSK